MKKITALFLFILIIGNVSHEVFGDAKYDWLTEGRWQIEVEDGKDYIYWHETPIGIFRKNTIPEGNAIYRRRLPSGYLNYFYPIGIEHMVRVGVDRDNDGQDDVMDIYSRNNYSVFFIETKDGLIFGGGERQGSVYDPEHPFVGIWLSGGKFDSEVRMVEPGEYVCFLEIGRIPGFSIRRGLFLLKEVEDGVLESDATFEDGHIRIEVISRELLRFIPLYELPEGEGRVEVMQLRAIGKVSNP